ncbi:hypothetical protein ACRRTK_016555 [Alexandromys fortis]
MPPMHLTASCVPVLSRVMPATPHTYTHHTGLLEPSAWEPLDISRGLPGKIVAASETF